MASLVIINEDYEGDRFNEDLNKNDVRFVHPKEISNDNEILQSQPTIANESRQFEYDFGEPSNVKNLDGGEEQGEKDQKSTYFSLENASNEKCSDAYHETHWTEVRKTEFLDSHKYQTPTLLVHLSDIMIGEKITEGGQGIIYEARLSRDIKPEFNLVLKTFKSVPESSPQGQWPDEIITPRSICLCALQGYVLQSDGSYALLMNRYDCDLRSFIDERMQSKNYKGQKPFNISESMYLIGHIAIGMRDLHLNYGITHKDLKTANVFIDVERREFDQIIKDIRIGDFESSSDVVGTFFWRAPEVLQALKERKREMVSKIFTTKADVYSFGMTCYEIVTGMIPLDEYPRSDYDVVLFEKRRPKLPKDLHPRLKDLISKCWNQDPDGRPSFEEIIIELKHIVESLEVTDYLRHLYIVFGMDEGYNGETTTLEADWEANLNHLQEMLHVNGAYFSKEKFASGHQFILLSKEFQQQFSFIVKENARHVTNQKWQKMLDLARDKGEEFVHILLQNGNEIPIVAMKDVLCISGRMMGQWKKLVHESVDFVLKGIDYLRSGKDGLISWSMVKGN